MGFFIALTPGASFNEFKANFKKEEVEVVGGLEFKDQKQKQVVVSAPITAGYNYCYNGFVVGFGVRGDAAGFINWKKSPLQVADWAGARVSVGYKVHDRVTVSALAGATLRQTKRLTIDGSITSKNAEGADVVTDAKFNLVNLSTPAKLSDETFKSQWQVLPFVGGEVSVRAVKGLSLIIGGEYTLPVLNKKTTKYGFAFANNTGRKPTGTTFSNNAGGTAAVTTTVAAGGFKIYAGAAFEIGGSK